jgi:hypothetical protein
VKNGIPFDLAFQLDEVTLAAYSIAFSELDGASFDWSTMKFKD